MSAYPAIFAFAESNIFSDSDPSLTDKLRRLPPPTTEEVPRWWEGRFRLTGGGMLSGNVAPFSVNVNERQWILNIKAW
jgi:hypothetical protein